jgi:pimeloyl-ACP methyl ester carboxylesterase
VGLLDAEGIGRAKIVSHDWGAAVGWALASLVHDRVGRLAALSVGHPAGYFAGNVEQLEKSWYTLWFLLPGVAEPGLAANGWPFLRRWTPDAADIDRWIAHCEAAPGNLTAMLNWYPANIDPAAFAGGPGLDLPPVTCPVLGIWSDGDAYCDEAQMVASATSWKGLGGTSGSRRVALVPGPSPPDPGQATWPPAGRTGGHACALWLATTGEIPLTVDSRLSRNLLRDGWRRFPRSSAQISTPLAVTVRSVVGPPRWAMGT